jgi:hypothetical protein
MTSPNPVDGQHGMRIAPPLLGREAETARLRQAIQNRQGLLISGPAGIGKTALVMKVLTNLPPAAAASTIYLSGVEGLQPFLRALLRGLAGAGDPTLRRQLRAEGVRTANFPSWLRSLPTSRLRGAVYRSMEGGQYWVFLDHMLPLTYAVAKVVKELVRMRDTPVYLLARGPGEGDAGHIANLYWSDRHRLPLGPLAEKAARELLEWCIGRFGLAPLDLDGFQDELLRLSGHNPGVLIKMCALAGEPRYHYGSQIKLKLIHIDSLVDGYARLRRASQVDRQRL